MTFCTEEVNYLILVAHTAMATNEEVAEYYDECSFDYRWAWTDSENLAVHYGYWDKDTKNLKEAQANINKVLTKIAKIKSDDVILDAGCGLGGSSIWLAKNIGSRVVGVTISKKQVDLATKFAKKYNVDHLVKFYHRDMTNTKFDAESFDVVWALESIIHLGNKRKFFLEANRLLKNRGRLIIGDGFIRKDRSEFSKNESKLSKLVDKYWVATPIKPEEYKKYLEDLSFKNIQYRDITDNILRSVWEVRVRGILLYPLAILLHWLDIRTKQVVYNAIACREQYELFKNRAYSFGIIYARK